MTESSNNVHAVSLYVDVQSSDIFDMNTHSSVSTYRSVCFSSSKDQQTLRQPPRQSFRVKHDFSAALETERRRRCLSSDQGGAGTRAGCGGHLAGFGLVWCQDPRRAGQAASTVGDETIRVHTKS